MNELNTAKRTAVVAALVEGNSIRATARMTNVSKPTILKLLGQLGNVCARYQDAVIRGLRSKRVESDEIWHSAMRSKRTFQRTSAARSGTVTCGHGQPSMPTAS